MNPNVDYVKVVDLLADTVKKLNRPCAAASAGATESKAEYNARMQRTRDNNYDLAQAEFARLREAEEARQLDAASVHIIIKHDKSGSDTFQGRFSWDTTVDQLKIKIHEVCQIHQPIGWTNLRYRHETLTNGTKSLRQLGIANGGIVTWWG